MFTLSHISADANRFAADSELLSALAYALNTISKAATDEARAKFYEDGHQHAIRQDHAFTLLAFCRSLDTSAAEAEDLAGYFTFKEAMRNLEKAKDISEALEVASEPVLEWVRALVGAPLTNPAADAQLEPGA